MDPPVHAPGDGRFVELKGQQERDHQRRDEERDHDRFDRHLGPKRDRTDERTPDEQVDDTEEHGRGERRQRNAIEVEPAGVRQIDDAEAAQEFGQRIPAESDESPEHERMHQAGQRPLADGLTLKNDVEEKAAGAEAEIGRAECVGRRRDQLNTPRHLRREGADAGQEEEPEGDGLHHVF